jgi:hypothetical protein
MRGIYLDGYILDEPADMHPDVRDKVLLATISDRQGWEIVIGTPKGHNSFKELYDKAVLNETGEWYSFRTDAYEVGEIPIEELEMLKRSMSKEAFDQEYMCSFDASPAGNYFQEEMLKSLEQGRITTVPYDKMYPVTTYWDLGFNDTTAIWFVQEVGNSLRVLRYFEDCGKGLDHYTKYLQSTGYEFNEHVLPHDANNHELSTGRTRVDFLRERGLNNIRVLERTKSKNEDIHAARMLIPICYFDSVGCSLGIKCLKEYQRKWDAKNKVFMETPLHNWASNGTDAFLQFAVDYRPGMSKRIQYQNKPQFAKVDYDILTDF